MAIFKNVEQELRKIPLENAYQLFGASIIIEYIVEIHQHIHMSYISMIKEEILVRKINELKIEAPATTILSHGFIIAIS